MKGPGLPQNAGQAMFPMDMDEGLVWILQQQEMKRNEAVNVTLTFSPTPKNYDVLEDDVTNSLKLWMTGEGFQYKDLGNMIARSGPKGHTCIVTMPAEVAQVKAPLSHYSHLSPWPLR